MSKIDDVLNYANKRNAAIEAAKASENFIVIGFSSGEGCIMRDSGLTYQQKSYMLMWADSAHRVDLVEGTVSDDG